MHFIVSRWLCSGQLGVKSYLALPSLYNLKRIDRLHAFSVLCVYLNTLVKLQSNMFWSVCILIGFIMYFRVWKIKYIYVLIYWISPLYGLRKKYNNVMEVVWEWRLSSRKHSDCVNYLSPPAKLKFIVLYL